MFEPQQSPMLVYTLLQLLHEQAHVKRRESLHLLSGAGLIVVPFIDNKVRNSFADQQCQVFNSCCKGVCVLAAGMCMTGSLRGRCQC